MFTGIVETVGRVGESTGRGTNRVFRIEAPEIAGELGAGASVAVDGACFTVVEADDRSFTVEAVGTTLSRTVAGRYGEGTLVNLERALALGGRLEGHLVQGHVDGTGRLVEIRVEGEYRLMDFDIPATVAEVTILHGSIAINGISFTVNALPGPHRCQVAVIPHTWEHTNLPTLAAGDAVNVEGDLIGKYVGTMARTWRAAAGAAGSPDHGGAEG